MDGQTAGIDPADWMSIALRVKEEFPGAVELDDAKAKNFQRNDPAPYISGTAGGR